MAVIDYPTSDLPLPLQGAFGEDNLETKVQDKGEVGAARRRNRFTRSLGRWKFTLQATEAQKAALYEFYEKTLVRGVEEFNWTHPTTSVTYEVVMTGRPKVNHFTAGFWKAEIELEEI